jgi:Putative transmembrane protein (PGPGW)
VILGSVIAVGSLLTAPLPGPGLATVSLGLAILAGELLPAARLLDWSEIRLRQLGRFVRAVWRTGATGNVAVVVVATILAAALLYVLYVLLFAG